MSTGSPAPGVRAAALERAHVVAPTGELDLYSAAEVRAALADRPERCDVVVLDLRGLAFVDTSGIRLVLETMEWLGAAGGRLALVRGRPEVQRLFVLAGMEGRLPFFDDLDEALEG